MQRMRILIQQKQTGLYFKDNANWTEQRSEATEFVSSTAAIDFCLQNKLADVQMVLRFDEEQAEIVLPLINDMGLSREDRPSHSM